MIIAIINIIFMWNFINSWKLISENPQHHPEKIHYPLFTHSLPKNSKSESPLSVPTLKNFQNSPTPPSPAERGKEALCFSKSSFSLYIPI